MWTSFSIKKTQIKPWTFTVDKHAGTVNTLIKNVYTVL